MKGNFIFKSTHKLEVDILTIDNLEVDILTISRHFGSQHFNVSPANGSE
jgi:hypothetical protein